MSVSYLSKLQKKAHFENDALLCLLICKLGRSLANMGLMIAVSFNMNF